ncbi:MAG: BREX system P-loop protein BrxC, partial [Polyangiaceae bacterium]
GLDALLAAENLNGLPPVFAALRLLRDEKGKTVFAAETGPLAEVLHRIEERAAYGDIASGKYLAEELAREPFGWDFEAVRLFVLSLLRAGKIEATSKSQTIDSATSVEARETFQNNNLFRSSAFKPRSGGCEFTDILQAAEHFRDVFGQEIKEIEEGLVATQIREALAREEPRLSEVLLTLGRNGLPGSEPLDAAVGAIRNIRARRDCPALQEFSATHKMLKDAIGRTANLLNALTEPHLLDLTRAKKALAVAWEFLKNEPDLDDALRGKAEELADILQRETFYRELAKIDQHARAVDAEYARRYEDALEKRVTTYAKALERLAAMAGWTELDDAQKGRISAPLRRCAERDQSSTIPQLRSDRDACESRLRDAVAEVRQIIEGERVVTVPVGTYFAGGIENEEQLEAALDGIREECSRLIGAGKKVFVQ